MTPLRDIVMLLVKNDVHLVPIWIPTKANELADDLLRLRYRKIADTHLQLRYLTISSPNEAVIYQNPDITRSI